MATDTAPTAPARRHYWQLPTFALGVAAVWLPVWAALPAEQRDGLVRAVRESFELVHVARGHP